MGTSLQRVAARPADRFCCASDARGTQPHRNARQSTGNFRQCLWPCGLLTALRFGDANWQKSAAAVAGATDRDRLLTIIRTWGLLPSKSLPSRKRWSRHGVNVDDLCDIGNEMTQNHWRQLMKCEVLLARPGETSPKLLARVHDRLSTSLERGLPPIISVRRIVKQGSDDRAGSWEVLQGHFVTVIAVPTVLEKSATEFPITYIDPWGGKRCSGHLRISTQAFVSGQSASPCLEADFPQADVGKKLAKKGASTLLTLAAAIGKW